MFVNARFVHWDATDKLSNTDLIREMTIRSETASRNLLVVANFSDFLQKIGKMGAALPQLEELFRHASRGEAVVVWIEPRMNTVIGSGGLFSRLTNWVREKCRKFARINTAGQDGQEVLVSECAFRSPLTRANTHRVTLAVMRFDLTRAMRGNVGALT